MPSTTARCPLAADDLGPWACPAAGGSITVQDDRWATRIRREAPDDRCPPPPTDPDHRGPPAFVGPARSAAPPGPAVNRVALTLGLLLVASSLGDATAAPGPWPGWDRLAEPGCTAFLIGEPATAYALCALQTREASVFSPPVRRLMIEHVAVAPEARRQGQGRALIAAARDLARELEVDEILLDTWAENQAAHAFFRAEGFQPRRMLFRAKP